MPSPDARVRELSARTAGYIRKGRPEQAEATRRELAEHQLARKLAAYPPPRRRAIVAAANAMDAQ